MIGRDHLDCGSVASPYRETEAMADGSDAIADWPLLNAMVNVASGASWVSIHHGGGVGMGRSIHAGQVSRRRRHAAGRAEARAGAHQRPGHGRDPACGRRLLRAPTRLPPSAASGSRCARADRASITGAPATAFIRPRTITGIITGAFGIVLAIVLIIVGVSILTSPGGKNLRSCLDKANGNQQAVQPCQDQYAAVNN